LHGFSEHDPLDDAAVLVLLDELTVEPELVELVVLELVVVAPPPLLELAAGEPPVDAVMPPDPELEPTVGVPVTAPPTPAPPAPKINGPEPVAQALVSAAVTRTSGDERMGRPPKKQQ
jgi:hypothetical protein